MDKPRKPHTGWHRTRKPKWSRNYDLSALPRSASESIRKVCRMHEPIPASKLHPEVVRKLQRRGVLQERKGYYTVKPDWREAYKLWLQRQL